MPEAACDGCTHPDRAIDDAGELVLSRSVPNHPPAVLEVLEGLGDDYRVALEATYGWEWLAELLEEEGYELHLAHPLRTRAIAAARVKTTQSTRALSRTCYAPTSCPRPTSPRGRYGTYAACCATGSS